MSALVRLDRRTRPGPRTGQLGSSAPPSGTPRHPPPHAHIRLSRLPLGFHPRVFHFDFSVPLRPRHLVLSCTGDSWTSRLAIPLVFRSITLRYDPPRSLRPTLTRPSAFTGADVARPTRRPLDVSTTADPTFGTVHPRHSRRPHARFLAPSRAPLSLHAHRIGRISGPRLSTAAHRTAALRQPRTAYIDSPNLSRHVPRPCYRPLRVYHATLVLTVCRTSTRSARALSSSCPRAIRCAAPSHRLSFYLPFCSVPVLDPTRMTSTTPTSLIRHLAHPR